MFKKFTQFNFKVNLNIILKRGENLIIQADKKTKNFIEVYTNKKMRMLSAKITNSKELLLPVPTKEAIEYLKYKEIEEDLVVKEKIKKLLQDEEGNFKNDISLLNQSESDAVKNTIDKFREKDSSIEETEEKTQIISESIRNFRKMEKEREKDKQLEEYNRQLEKEKEREKILEQESKREKEREKEKLKEIEQEKKKRERDLEILEEVEKKREEFILNNQNSNNFYYYFNYNNKYNNSKKRKKYIFEDYNEEEEELKRKLKKKKEEEEEELKKKKLEEEGLKIKINIEENKTIIENNELIFKSNDKEDEDEEDSLFIKKNTSFSIEMKKNELLDPKNIIKLVPVEKEDLYNYTIDWDFVDKYNISETLRDFVNKKIYSFYGQEEKTLVDLIITQISLHISPKELENNISPFIENESELFILKLWRMLIFNIKKFEIEENIRNNKF
jgi:RNA-binding protein 25